MVLADGWSVGYWHYGCEPGGSSKPMAWGARLFCPVPTLPGSIRTAEIDGCAYERDLRSLIVSALVNHGWAAAIDAWQR